MILNEKENVRNIHLYYLHRLLKMSYTQLDCLIIIGNYKQVKQLIKTNPEQIRRISQGEESLLMTAVICDEYKIVDLLLKNHAVVTKEILVRAAGFQSSSQYSCDKNLMEGSPEKEFKKLLKHATPETIRRFSTEMPTCKLRNGKRASLENALLITA